MKSPAERVCRYVRWVRAALEGEENAPCKQTGSLEKKGRRQAESEQIILLKLPVLHIFSSPLRVNDRVGRDHTYSTFCIWNQMVGAGEGHLWGILNEYNKQKKKAFLSDSCIKGKSRYRQTWNFSVILFSLQWVNSDNWKQEWKPSQKVSLDWTPENIKRWENIVCPGVLFQIWWAVAIIQPPLFNVSCQQPWLLNLEAATILHM